MASITIRGLPESTKKNLHIKAAEAGLSLETYARQVLQTASYSTGGGSLNILDVAEKYFGSLHGVELELPKRRSSRALVGPVS